MAGRLFRILVCVSICGALGTTPALAQGGSTSTTPSAGDNQYIDPLATPAKPHHHHRAKPKTSTTSPSTSPSSVVTNASSSSSEPQQSSTAPIVTSTPSSHTTSAVTAKPKKHNRAKSHAKRTTSPASHTPPPVVNPSPSNAVSSPGRSGSTFPYVYLVLAACAAIGVGLLGRRLLFRRAVRRA